MDFAATQPIRFRQPSGTVSSTKCARGIPVIGLRTDLRPGEDGGLPNCMLTRSCVAVVRSIEAAVAASTG